MVFVHAFGGGIAANLISRGRSFSEKHKSIVYTLGILGGIFPDFDVIFLLLGIFDNHRSLLTHSVVPYTLGVLIWIVLTRAKLQLRFYGIVFYIGILTHLFLDFVTGGLVLLAPITNQVFGIIYPSFDDPLDWARYYFGSWKFMLSEFIVVLVYLLLTLREKNLAIRLLPWAIMLVAVVMISTLLYL